jgi:transcriptional regulator with XRE-family HTH domain
VRELRNASGMTQEDLSERCGLFRTYMSRIETGRANPTLTMVQALANSLGVPVVALFEEVAPATAARTGKPARSPSTTVPAKTTPKLSRGRVKR